MIVVVPSVHENDATGFEEVMDHANEVFVEMVKEDVITATRMPLWVWQRAACTNGQSS